MSVEGLAARIDALITEPGFSGVIRAERAGETVLNSAGWAHRAHEVAMTVDTRLAIASGSKWLTALVVLSLAVGGTHFP
jgi:CubicO group peptidase (beta-lactamase class C family)